MRAYWEWPSPARGMPIPIGVRRSGGSVGPPDFSFTRPSIIHPSIHPSHPLPTTATRHPSKGVQGKKGEKRREERAELQHQKLGRHRKFPVNMRRMNIDMYVCMYVILTHVPTFQSGFPHNATTVRMEYVVVPAANAFPSFSFSALFLVNRVFTPAYYFNGAHSFIILHR
ncbi:hypothetical protein F5Y01DRAFT_172196 [Xylaria sp. FL0043]|nr:hypothetical protein F5Y01DRAFT_172196 [Xylaria sp. FL0043]